MMLIDPLGKSHGLISGGCLEANIRELARRVHVSGKSLCPVYDTTDEDSIASELGLGCNGRVEILIQEITAEHRSVLLQLLERLESGKTSYLVHCFSSEDPADLQQMVLLDENRHLLSSALPAPLPDLAVLPEKHHAVIVEDGMRWSLNRYLPPLKFWVFGGGIDARPMVRLASQLGWRVTLLDHRIEHARQQDFPDAETILRQTPDQFETAIHADAAVLMTHNISLDATWLKHLQHCGSLGYTGLLGPVDRKQEVIELAGINPQSDFALSIHGPMGLDIGGDTPESVALSTLAQCHQVLYSGQAGRH